MKKPNREEALRNLSWIKSVTTSIETVEQARNWLSFTKRVMYRDTRVGSFERSLYREATKEIVSVRDKLKPIALTPRHDLCFSKHKSTKRHRPTLRSRRRDTTIYYSSHSII